MRAIVIDPYRKTIEKIDLPRDDKEAWDEAKKIIFAQGPHAAGDHYLQIIQLGAGILMLVDEEGILIDWSKQAFFRLGGENCYAGTAILLGDAREWEPIDDPEKQPDFCSVPLLGVEALQAPPARLEWIPPELAHYPAVAINGVPIGEPYTFTNQPQHAQIDAAVAKAFSGLL